MNLTLNFVSEEISVNNQKSGSTSPKLKVCSKTSDLPPSRYHLTKNFKRRVTFNEAVQVFELPATHTGAPQTSTHDGGGANAHNNCGATEPIVPYTKTRMKIKKDRVKFEEIVSILN